ncbi:asparagine synthase (glutamine-hydrolyzing) [Methylolobus aquaticus]
MCAIAGVFQYRAGSVGSAIERVVSICDAMQTRGPDGAGLWVSPEGNAVLGHRRLAILDLTEAGNQPMVDFFNERVLVFNGEIYNFRELRNELEEKGHCFRSDSDTEVILVGYREWGEGLLPRLRGMFAFAMWDGEVRSLLLARDPYGIKPLYFTDQGGRFAFCSQVRPLRDHIAIDDSPDPTALVGFMLLGSIPEPRTALRAIRALPAGHSLWVTESGSGATREYCSVVDIWRSAAEFPRLVPADALLDQVRAAVRNSVTAHQVSDVPVGAFLSAGIDSGALVGLMAEGRTMPLQTVTLGFSEFRGTSEDEVGYAERLASHYGTAHRTVWISDAEAVGAFPRALTDMDQPSIDGFNTWLVSKHTAKLGLKVVVSGVGGDELFGGYAHFAELPVWRRRLQMVGRVPGLARLLCVGARLGHRFGWVPVKAEGLARTGPDLAGLYLVRRGLFMPWELPALLDGDLLREGLADLPPPFFVRETLGSWPGGEYAAIAALEASFYLRNQLLRDSDWASMAHSLELRTPLVDIQLLRDLAPVLAAPRPPGLPGKRSLALAPRPALPAEVIDRPKSGFSLPMDRWLAQTQLLDAWRRVPLLTRPGCHWSRRMAYGLVAEWIK